MAMFEIGIYNALVKEAMKNGERSSYSDDWAEIHYIEVSARDEMDARRKILSKYPKDKGFVITNISIA